VGWGVGGLEGEGGGGGVRVGSVDEVSKGSGLVWGLGLGLGVGDGGFPLKCLKGVARFGLGRRRRLHLCQERAQPMASPHTASSEATTHPRQHRNPNQSKPGNPNLNPPPTPQELQAEVAAACADLALSPPLAVAVTLGALGSVNVFR